MSYFASIGGQRIVSGSIGIPLYGLWSGDVTISSSDAVPEKTSVTLGNLTMTGAVYRDADFAGNRILRLVGGYGGWRKVVPSRQYSQARGVSLRMILNDAAGEVGERVGLAADRTVGPAYVRHRGAASSVLRQLAGESWYVDNAGITQIKAWPTGIVQSQFNAIVQNGGQGIVEIATEDYASWMPNRSFTAPNLDGTYTIRGVLYRFFADGKFRLEVMT